MPLPITTILTDIEGTTSAVSFVFDVLFPYAREHLPTFVLAHAERPDVAEQLQAVRVTVAEPEASTERVVEILLQWLAEDRKATPLKALQGMVWAEGYQAGTLKGHVYPDAVAALRQWHTQGLALYVYSSGSVQAQKLIFGCSEHGDLTPLFSGYFDTTSGGKREAAAYRTIAESMGVTAQSVLFLSDIVEELDAAREAGMQTCGVAREGGVLIGHQTAGDFARIVIDS